MQHAIADSAKIATQGLNFFVLGSGEAELGEQGLEVFLVQSTVFFPEKMYTY